MDKPKNLNALRSRFFYGNRFRPRDEDYRDMALRDYSILTPQTSDITVHFDGIEELIVDLAGRHEVAVGAVAWLTNTQILRALSRTDRTAIVVQKEDFLRRDADASSYPSWRDNLHSLYSSLNGFNYDDFSEAYPGQQEDDPDYCRAVQMWLVDHRGLYMGGTEAIRCLGYANGSDRASPRLHHKFLVFGDRHDGLIMRPRCVLTGSFNMTLNAVRSRENVVVIRNSDVCRSYLSEWAQLWCMSESLNWSSPEPVVSEMDMGT